MDAKIDFFLLIISNSFLNHCFLSPPIHFIFQTVDSHFAKNKMDQAIALHKILQYFCTSCPHCLHCPPSIASWPSSGPLTSFSIQCKHCHFSLALPWSPSGIEMSLMSAPKPTGACSFQRSSYCSLATSILSLNCGLSAPWKLASHLITFVNHTMMVKRKISLMFTWDMLNKTKEIWQREWKKRREGRKANSALVHDVFFLSPCHQWANVRKSPEGKDCLALRG